MNLFDISFWIASAVIVTCLVGLVFAKNVKASMIGGLTALFSVSSLYFLLGSGYAAFLHIIFCVYLTGLVMLLAARSSGELYSKSVNGGSGLGILIASVFGALLTTVLISSKWIELPPDKFLLPVLEITRILQIGYFLPLLLLTLIIFTFVIGIGSSVDRQKKIKDS